MSFTPNRRTGLPSLMNAARILCRLLGDFSPIIEKLYPHNAALLAALAAARAACMALEIEIKQELQSGV